MRPVQNNWYSTKIIWTIQNNFGPIEGQGIRELKKYFVKTQMNRYSNAPSDFFFSVVLAYLRLQHTHWAYLKENLQFIALQNRTPPIAKIICVKNARAWVLLWFHI